MTLRKPLVVVSGQVQEIPTGDSPWTFTIGIGDASNAAASTQFVTNAIGKGLVKDVGSGGTTTLNATEAANSLITVTGALTSNAILEVPINVYRTYVVSNETTGAFSLSVKQASASPVAAVARGKRNIVVSVGNGVYDAQTDYESIVLTGVPLAPTMPTSADGFEVANTAFVKAAIAAAPAPAGASAKQFYFHTANTTLTVPADVSVVRFYAGGKGGDGGYSNSMGGNGGGGGGGFAFGDLAVAAGDLINISFVSGVTTVRRNGTVVGTANAGLNASGGGTAGGTGGTASITAAVTNGGAYSGGAGGSGTSAAGSGAAGGGGSCGSPLGAGFRGGNAFASGGSVAIGVGGGGIGGAGADQSPTTVPIDAVYGGGGAGAPGTATASGGSAPNGIGRGILNSFTDPLLRHAVSPWAAALYYGGSGAGPAPGAGAGGIVSGGGDFGGGAGLSSTHSYLSVQTVGFPGGLMGGGGGIARTAGSAVVGGAGGYGGGGGGCTVPQPSGGIIGYGGSAFCFLYY